ncbi:hypothetical protein D3C76_1069850 [compost metagenome]
MQTSCKTWSYALCKKVEYTAKTGFNPSAAIPAANVTACCSAIPTSKNLFGNNLEYSFNPVPSGMAAVIATISSLSSESLTIAFENALEYVISFEAFISPFIELKGETP